ncbi:MAG: biliverdin-producing heme oxygenase [Leeuwenhoekiella sp.]
MILESLKAQTESLHKEVEQDNLAQYIMNHSITEELYKQLLFQNYTAYSEIEQKIAENRSILPDFLLPFADGKKTSDLMLDLKQLGKNEFTSELKPRFEVTSAAHIIGMMYVIEGSMMGGMLMARNLKKCENLTSIKEHHFFNGNVKEILARWKDFSESVQKEEYSEQQISDAVNAAQETFRFFGYAFENKAVNTD